VNEMTYHNKSGVSATAVRSPSEQLMAALLQPTPKTVLLTGTEAVYRFSLRCAARIATLRRVVYLDGANVFNPYELARYANERGFSEETLLKSVFVRRAFTCYQMYEMVARLPIDRLMASHAVLVVAGPCDTFFDESITGNRAARLFYRMLYRLEDVTRADVPMLIVQPNECSLTARGYFLTDLRRLGRVELEIGECQKAVGSGQ